MNVKIFNPDTNRYVLSRGKIGETLTAIIVNYILKGKNNRLKALENSEVLFINNRRDIDITQRRILVKTVRDVYNSQRKIEKKAEKDAKFNLRLGHYHQKLALEAKRIAQSKINTDVLTLALKDQDLELRSDSKLCQEYIDDYGKRTYKTDINTVVRRMGEMRFLFDYLDVTQFINQGHNMENAEKMANPAYPVIFPWIFEKLAYKMIAPYLPDELIKIICDYVNVKPVKKTEYARRQYIRDDEDEDEEIYNQHYEYNHRRRRYNS